MPSSKIIIAVAITSGALGAVLGLFSNLIVPTERHISAHASVPNAPSAETPVVSTQLGQSLIQLVQVQEELVRHVVTLNGKLALDGTRVHQVSARLAGRVDRIDVVEGSMVQAGQSIAWLYSPEFISAQNEFLLARQAVKTLSASRSSELQADAQATLDGARHKLRVLGAAEDDIAELARSGLPQQHLVIRAAIKGRVIKRNIDPGGYLETGASLGTVADFSSLWFLGFVFDADLPRIKEGQQVEIVVNGVALAEPLIGKVSFVSPSVDPVTHSVSVRVQLPNPNGLLKPEMFARAELMLNQRRLPVVPRAAVVQDGAESFLVVRRGGTEGKPTYVRLPVEFVPANDPGHLAILRGVSAGESVVVEGSVLVERELHQTQAARATSVQRAVGDK